MTICVLEVGYVGCTMLCGEYYYCVIKDH